MVLPRPIVAVAAAALALLAAAPSASAAGRACTSANAAASQVSKRVLVRATLCVLNAERARHDLRPLRLNRRLSRAARRHSRAMARRRFFSHTSPGGSTFVERIRHTGYLRGARNWNIGENIAWGSGGLSAPRAVATAWMNSPRAPGEHPQPLVRRHRDRRRPRHPVRGRAAPSTRPTSAAPSVASRPCRPYATAASSTPSSTRSDSRLSAIRWSTASSTARWTSGHGPVSSMSSGSAPPIVRPPSKRSKTRGSM